MADLVNGAKSPVREPSHKPKIDVKKMTAKGGKRHSKLLPEGQISGVTKAAIRRLARRGGVKRISQLTYDEVRETLQERLQKVVHDAWLLAENAKRKTVTAEDVSYSLKKNSMHTYIADR